MQASASVTSPPRAISPGTMKMTQRFFGARKQSADASLVLLRAQQSFLKKLEDTRALKRAIDSQREAYIESSAIFAHRDAELRYQRELLLQEEQAWSDLLETRQERISDLRKELQTALDSYGEERRKTAALQERISHRTEAQRIAALNAVAFCSYAQALIERELKQSLGATEQATILGPARQAEKIMTLYTKSLAKSRQMTKTFHEEKIAEFRRQERILLGRGKDATSQLLLNTSPTRTMTANSTKHSSEGDGNGNHSNNNNNTAFHDSLETRIAQKMFALGNDNTHPQSSFMQRMEDEHHTDNTEMLADILRSDSKDNNANPLLAHRPAILRQRRASIMINGEIQVLPQITNPNAQKQLKQQAKVDLDTSSTIAKNYNSSKAIYEPERYHPACAGDFLKPHTLLENSTFLTSNPSLGSDSKLLQLAMLCCEARGKLQQLTVARDGLDVMVTKQAALLLTVTNGLVLDSSMATVGTNTTQVQVQLGFSQQPLQPIGQPSPNTRNPRGGNNRVFRPFNSSSKHDVKVSIAQQLQLQQASARPLQLSAARRIVQLDCAQKDQDIRLLRSKVLAALQQHGREAPHTAPGRLDQDGL